MPFLHRAILQDDEKFALVAISLFMQIVGFLRMPQVLGPTFNPFEALVALSGRRVKTTLVVEIEPKGIATHCNDRAKKDVVEQTNTPPLQDVTIDLVTSLHKESPDEWSKSTKEPHAKRTFLKWRRKKIKSQ